MHPTETRPAEPELQFRTAYENLPVGIAHVACDGRLLRVNARLCEMGDCERDALVGLRIENLVPRDDLNAVARHALRLLSGESARASVEMHVLRPGGGLLRTRVSLSLQRNAAGRPGHFVAVVDEAGTHASGEAALPARPAGDAEALIGQDLRQPPADEERLARHAERQALLLELSSGMLRAGQDEAAQARPLLKRIGAHLNADIHFDHAADTPAGALQWIAGLGMPIELRKAVRQPPPAAPLDGAESVAAETLVLGEPFVVAREDGTFLSALGVRAYVGHPLHARDGRALGTLALSSTRREAFTPDELDFFRTLCHFIVLAGKRLLSEQELRKRKQQYRMALEAKRLGSWRREILDSDIYHLDARAQAHYGLERADPTEAALLERVHPEDRPQVEQYIALGKRQRVGQDSQGIEYRVVHADGGTRWLSVHAKLVLEVRQGAPVLVRHGITADITERKHAEQALLEERAVLHRAQALAGVGHWRFGPRYAPGPCSAQAGRILGVPAGRPLDRSRFLSCVHPEDRARVEQAWKAAAAGAPPCDIEHRIVLGSQVKRVRHKAELEFDAQGELLGGLVTVQELG